MHTSKGSLILTALSPDADGPQLIAYLAKRAKNIPSDEIPTLLQSLPVVLSRNVAKEIGILVVRRLSELGAEAQFVPNPCDTAAGMPLPETHEPDGLVAPAQPSFLRGIGAGIVANLRRVSKNFWIIAAMLAGALLVNLIIASRYPILGLYTLPTVVSAYFFGRRWALYTAFAGILIVGLFSLVAPESWDVSQWSHSAAWGCALLAIACAMGILHEKDKSKDQEIRHAYQGLLLILSHIATHDKKRKDHCFRVSIFATRIAAHLGLDKNGIEDIRSAALLHDLGRMQLSRTILRKASAQWFVQDTASRERAGDDTIDEGILSGPVSRILPLLIGTQEQMAPSSGKQVGTSILAVADAYDALTFGDHNQNAVSPAEAFDAIVARSGDEFDPEVVQAFATAFSRMEMELPAIIL